MVSDLSYANRVVKHVQQDPKVGMTFRPGLLWPTHSSVAAGERPRICIAAVSDASHGGEDEWLDDWEEREPFRSQGAKLVFIASTDILDTDEGFVHLISFSSTIQKRVVSSTMKAESYQLAEVVEAADLLRAALADCHGQLDHANWETSAASWTTSQWSTDCRSCHDTLQKPVTRGIDKRLGIELASLRQFLWRQRGEDKPDKRLLEDRPHVPTDVCRWVDTTVMVCDCLTKLMKEDFLIKVIFTNVWNSAQTEEAKATKTRKSEGAHRRKAEKKEDAQQEPAEIHAEAGDELDTAG